MSPREERDDDLRAVAPGGRRTVGRYQLLAVLGRGGMADVYLALSRGPMGFSKLVVLKRLRRALAEDKNFREMFLDEARLAARLNHANVVQTHEVGEDDGVYFIAMEYLEGQSLNKIIRELSKRDEMLPPLLCARVVSDALAGLHYAHELKDFDGAPLSIIHRDVSPHNVFVAYDGSVKMVDFGIAKAALSSAQTEVGVLKGKVAYMAPEQAAGEDIDPRADVFAMGIVLWELLAQQRLMTGDSAAATLHRLLSVPIPRVSTVRPDVGRDLEAVLSKALEKDRSRRFPSALAMRDALEDCIAAGGKAIRQEQIGREVSELFADVRVAIQRQIQEHMASGAAPLPPDETGAGVDGASGPTPSLGPLPTLGVAGGSGSGVVAGYSAPNHSAPGGEALRAGAAAGRRGVFVWLLSSGLVGLVAVLAFSFGRSRPTGSSAPADSVTEFRSAASPPASAAPATTPLPVPSARVDPASPAEPPAASASVAARPVAQRARHGSAPPVAAAPAAAPADDGSQGFLTFDTYPWTQVSENGKSLGTTPLLRVPLSPGTHTLVLTNDAQGIKTTYAVTLKGGEAISRRLGLK